jgi:hypothetical protein
MEEAKGGASRKRRAAIAIMVPNALQRVALNSSVVE